MIEISISQISLKQALGNCQMNIGVKCGERKEILYQQFSSTQKIIKYSQPHQYVFDNQNTKFVKLKYNSFVSCNFILKFLMNKDILNFQAVQNCLLMKFKEEKFLIKQNLNMVTQ
ncbi:unnamed protein product [Paramecium primaurelia]|uniref:Uncharacterized protein n=1 Tax=Paramecium primaurelia TaxID=5886 RepID=A0A8S1JT02_PARPR|nr:unnamed protein product [Paramecium primaurelia]